MLPNWLQILLISISISVLLIVLLLFVWAMLKVASEADDAAEDYGTTLIEQKEKEQEKEDLKNDIEY